MAGFFAKLYLFWAGWQAGAYGLVILALLTSVVSIYYYIRVVKMMVVKEPHEMSLVIQNYPETNWEPLGMRPLQVGVLVTLVLTMLAGVLSNPLFTLVNTSVASVPVFNQVSQVRATDSVAMQVPATAPDLEQL